ncbi:MAG: ribosome silencing factor [Muribaculaceae bacterium]|nr:ribosome silencing factor [Muribaculaceae bacterium]MDE5595528.1 ribosome silencing factor [Muribaculaceae bacterium]
MKNNNSLQQFIIEGIQERKGKNITIVDMSAIESAAASQFIIAEGSSRMQVGAIADSVREYVQDKTSIKPYNYDGYTNSEWIVVDYGDTLVHIFIPEVRDRYNLEELWSDAVISEVPNID